MDNFSKQTIWGTIAWLLGAAFFLYEFFLRVFTGTLSTTLIHEFHLSTAQFALIGSFYYLSYSLLQIPVGIFFARFGIKRVLSVACLVCIAGLALFLMAYSYRELLAARLFMGAGSAVAFTALLMIGFDWFPIKYYGFFAGATQILGALGPILAGVPFVLAINRAGGDWRNVMWWVVALGLGLLICILILLKEHGTHKQTYQQNSLSKLIISTWRLLHNKQVRSIALFAFLSYASIPVLGTIWGELYVQSLGFSLQASAAVVSALWLGLAIGSPMVGMLSDYLEKRKRLLLLCVIFGFINSVVLLLLPASCHVLVIYLALFFAIGVAGGCQTLSFTALSAVVDKEIYACAIGLNNTAVMLGGIVVPPLIGLVLKLDHVTLGVQSAMLSKQSLPVVLRQALLIVPALFLLSALVAWLLIEEQS